MSAVELLEAFSLDGLPPHLRRRIKVQPNGCWQWVGATNGAKGYGIFRESGDAKWSMAHRIVYEALVGPIPAKLVPDHICRNHGCVYPGHLDLVSNRTNILRGTGPTAQNARKKFCKRGHWLGGENLIKRVRNGWPQRECRQCHNAATRLWNDKQKKKREAE